MTEHSRHWVSLGIGDGASTGYNQQEIYDFLRKIFVGDQGTSQGPLINVDNELEVTGVATPLQMDTGAAIVYGFFYENTTPINLVVTTPAMGTTGGRVNLKADWATQEVRAEVVLGTDGDPTIPPLSQIAGTEWEIPLYTFTVTTLDEITLVDVRDWVAMSTEVINEMIRNALALSIIGRAGNTIGDIADIVATADHLALRRDGNTIGFGTIATDGIANDAITEPKIVDNAVGTLQILNGAITANKIANFVYRRQGGHIENWILAGVSTYIPDRTIIQTGAKTGTFWVTYPDYLDVTITFPQAFSHEPLVFATLMDSTYSTLGAIRVHSITNTGFTINWRGFVGGGSVETVTFYWLAIGPE